MYLRIRRMLEPCTGCHHMSIFEEPLIIWLQGGPGASGSGYGNFMVRNFINLSPQKKVQLPRKHESSEMLPVWI